MFFVIAVFLPHASFAQVAAPTAPVNVNDYRWKGNPIILKTSQVFGTGEDRKRCGSQDYEVCVGPAELKTPPTEGPNNALVIKCFIPKNQTTCPVDIKSSEQCYVATAGAPTNPGARPRCKIGQPQNDNLTYGCNCYHYGRPNDIRPTAAICKADKDRRDREYRDYVTRLCRAPYSVQCKNTCSPVTNNLQICKAVRAAGSGSGGSGTPVCANHGTWNVASNSCSCDDGFRLEGGTCVARFTATTCPEHSSWVAPSDTCECDSGYRMSMGICLPAAPTVDSCAPHGRMGTGGVCTCDAGFVDTLGSCMAPATTCTNGTMTAGVCQCYPYYRLVSGVCTLEDSDACAQDDYDTAVGDSAGCDPTTTTCPTN